MGQYSTGTVHRIIRVIDKVYSQSCLSQKKRSNTTFDELGYTLTEEQARALVDLDSKQYPQAGYRIDRCPALISDAGTFFLITDQKYLRRT